MLNNYSGVLIPSNAPIKGRVLFACFVFELDERMQQAPTRFPTEERSTWYLEGVVSCARCSVWTKVTGTFAR